MAGSSYSYTGSYTGKVVDVTIGKSGVYDITAYGAQGGSAPFASGGFGAEISRDSNLTVGETLAILVGGQGASNQGGGGGSGGTVVVVEVGDGTYTPLIIAGGGGGGTYGSVGGEGQVSSAGQDGVGQYFGVRGQHGGGGGGGSFDGGTNSAVDSGNGLVTIDFIAVCYLCGTRILTDRGEIAVEKLSVGDFVVTASGESLPIRWIGRRDINCAAHPQAEKVWPVRIAAGALGAGLPARDLWVSPEHCLFLDGALVPARLLVNQTTIVQEPAARVSYWHVELARHDLLVAEGAAAESYLDCNNRKTFANGGVAMSLHADFSGGDWHEEAFWAAHGCAPRLLEGPALRALQRRLAGRAAAMGLRARTTSDPSVQVLADGEGLTPVSVAENCFRFEAPAGVETLRLRSRSAIAARLFELDRADARRLGVLLSRLEIDGRDIALDDPALGEGWHEVERKGERCWRWSDGDAALPIGRSLTLCLQPQPAAYPLPLRAPLERIA